MTAHLVLLLLLMTVIQSDSASCGSATSCLDCMQTAGLPLFGCVWCPSTASCHNFDSPLDKCEIPINTPGQCWSATCPHQLGQMLEDRPDAMKNIVLITIKAARLPLHPFLTYNSTETGVFDLESGQQLAAAELPHTSQAEEDHEIRIAMAADWASGA